MPLFVCVQVLYASEGRVESAVTVLMYFILESGIMKTVLFLKELSLGQIVIFFPILYT